MDFLRGFATTSPTKDLADDNSGRRVVLKQKSKKEISMNDSDGHSDAGISSQPKSIAFHR
jgi:hypothetical protein